MTLTFKDSVAYGAESGIVILKKIPKGHQKSKQKGEETTIPEFKPLKTDGSDEFSFKNIVGKFFHASTSLEPDETTVKTEHGDGDEIEVEPPKGYLDVEAHKNSAPFAYNNYDDLQPPKTSPSTSYNKYTTLSNKKPNTFEEVNYETHPELYEEEESENKPSDGFKLSKTELDFLKNYFIKSQSPNNSTGSYDFSKGTSYKPVVSSPESLPNIESFPPYPGELPTEFVAKYGQQIQGYGLQNFNFGGFKLNPANNPFEKIKSNHFDPRHKRYPSPPKQNIRFTPPQKLRPVRPPQKYFPASAHNLRLKSPPPPINVVKSLTYELGPNGPIKV